MSELSGNVPILGQEQAKVRTQPAYLVSLVRSLDENGQFEPESTFLNNGQVTAIAGRPNICSAEDLCDMITDAVMAQLRVEIRKLLKGE